MIPTLDEFRIMREAHGLRRGSDSRLLLALFRAMNTLAPDYRYQRDDVVLAGGDPLLWMSRVRTALRSAPVRSVSIFLSQHYTGAPYAALHDRQFRSAVRPIPAVQDLPVAFDCFADEIFERGIRVTLVKDPVRVFSANGRYLCVVDRQDEAPRPDADNTRDDFYPRLVPAGSEAAQEILQESREIWLGAMRSFEKSLGAIASNIPAGKRSCDAISTRCLWLDSYATGHVRLIGEQNSAGISCGNFARRPDGTISEVINAWRRDLCDGGLPCPAL